MKFVAMYKDPSKRWLQRVEIAFLVLIFPVACVWGGQAAQTWTKFRQAESLYERAELMLEQHKEFDAAIALLHESVEVYPEFLPAWEALGLAYHMSGAHAKEVAVLKQAATIFHQEHTVHRDLATAYHEVGEHALELRHLERAAELPVVDEIFLASLLKRARAEAAGRYPEVKN